jgi:hypothetical protein
MGHSTTRAAQKAMVAGCGIRLIKPASWAGTIGVGDGNRTRTVSLGSSAVTAARGTDQAPWQS